ncbi:MAG: hypothetical protein M0R32_09015 [Candidatus Cloacimonetes bacterium]|jgi:uncharacterized protein YlxW (UPF0749 family)|nr:hypothetical protein [Candidatus Cloacimonadota bacterium]
MSGRKTVWDTAERLAEEKRSLIEENEALSEEVKELKKKVRCIQRENNRRLKALHYVATVLSELRHGTSKILKVRNGAIVESHPADDC